jgi:hypothetical protein
LNAAVVETEVAELAVAAVPAVATTLPAAIATRLDGANEAAFAGESVGPPEARPQALLAASAWLRGIRTACGVDAHGAVWRAVDGVESAASAASASPTLPGCTGSPSAVDATRLSDARRLGACVASIPARARRAPDRRIIASTGDHHPTHNYKTHQGLRRKNSHTDQLPLVEDSAHISLQQCSDFSESTVG